MATAPRRNVETRVRTDQGEIRESMLDTAIAAGSLATSVVSTTVAVKSYKQGQATQQQQSAPVPTQGTQQTDAEPFNWPERR